MSGIQLVTAQLGPAELYTGILSIDYTSIYLSYSTIYYQCIELKIIFHENEHKSIKTCCSKSLDFPLLAFLQSLDGFSSFAEGTSHAAGQFLRRSFSTLNLTSKKPGWLRAVINVFTVVFLVEIFDHSSIMQRSSFCLAFLDHRWSLLLACKILHSNKNYQNHDDGDKFKDLILTSLSFSLANLAKFLFSFLAKTILSLCTMLLLLISTKISSQLPKNTKIIKSP